MATVIYNNIIPFKGYKAITIFPFVFARRKTKPLDDVTLNHEGIHLSQQLEVLLASVVLMFLVVTVTNISWWWMLATLPVYYLWYGIEYLLRLAIYRSGKDAYYNVSFEQEAYINQRDSGYMKSRKRYAWTRYLHRRNFTLSQISSDRN